MSLLSQSYLVAVTYKFVGFTLDAREKNGNKSI
jgi:hypothetical protein